MTEDAAQFADWAVRVMCRAVPTDQHEAAMAWMASRKPVATAGLLARYRRQVDDFLNQVDPYGPASRLHTAAEGKPSAVLALAFMRAYDLPGLLDGGTAGPSRLSPTAENWKYWLVERWAPPAA